MQEILGEHQTDCHYQFLDYFPKSGHYQGRLHVKTHVEAIRLKSVLMHYM